MTPARWQVQLVAAVVSVALTSGAVAAYNHGQREIGRRDIMLAQTRADLQQARRLADSLEKVYRVDTLRLWRTVRALDTQTVTVERWKHDTLEVVRYVQRADSAVNACTLAVGTCEQRVGAERAGRVAAERQVKVLEASLPGTLTPWRHRLEGAALAAGSVWLAGRLRAP